VSSGTGSSPPSPPEACPWCGGAHGEAGCPPHVRAVEWSLAPDGTRFVSRVEFVTLADMPAAVRGPGAEPDEAAADYERLAPMKGA
jgi:hypothetical protein